MNPNDIIQFWFEEIDSNNWYAKDDAFDALLLQRFGAYHAAAVAGELAEWRSSAAGRLAEIIILDQFSRNLWRDTARAFAADSMALALAQDAIAAGADQELTGAQKAFLYMPFMHSESAQIHQQALQLFSQDGMQATLAFERRHHAIIERFGRYPHRNAILGRESSPAELAFLTQPGSSF